MLYCYEFAFLKYCLTAELLRRSERIAPLSFLCGSLFRRTTLPPVKKEGKTVHYAAINEVSREIPPGIIQKYGDSALFTAYGCVLLECETGKGYTYRALNLKTGRSAVIHRRTNPLMISGVAAMTERIRLSPVAGKGKYEIDMPPGENLLRESLADIQNHIFEAILPEHGYGLREKQMELAAHILEAIGHRTVSLSEADVGTGKTHA